MNIPSAAVSFQLVVEECEAGKLSKKQGLRLLKTKYESAYINIKEKLGKDFISFCCYVPCDFDEYIKICDGAERNKPLPERLNYDKIIQDVIERVTARYKENDLSLPEKAEREAAIDVYKEVHQIQNLCRENREMTEWYEKYKAEIEAVPDTSQSSNVMQKPALLVVFALYPQFQKDYELMNKDYFTETPNGLHWVKKKRALAEYFGNLPLPRGRKIRAWKQIEILFNVEDLKNSFSKNGNAYPKVKSSDYQKLLKILGRNNTP